MTRSVWQRKCVFRLYTKHSSVGQAEAKKMQSALSQAIVTEKPNVKWDDVAGLDQAKDLLKEVCLLLALCRGLDSY